MSFEVWFFCSLDIPHGVLLTCTFHEFWRSGQILRCFIVQIFGGLIWKWVSPGNIALISSTCLEATSLRFFLVPTDNESFRPQTLVRVCLCLWIFRGVPSLPPTQHNGQDKWISLLIPICEVGNSPVYWKCGPLEY